MTEKYKVIYSPAALEDLDNIYYYIAYKLKEKQVAKNLIKRIYKAVRSLCEYPERFRKVELKPWESMGMRQLTEGNYIIFYLPDTYQRTLTIFRIVYGGRDIGNVMNGE